jgi:hypothetical protein
LLLLLLAPRSLRPQTRLLCLLSSRRRPSCCYGVSTVSLPPPFTQLLLLLPLHWRLPKQGMQVPVSALRMRSVRSTL